MEYRTLGKTGLKISEIGMGTWQLANDPGMWVGSDINESYKALQKYVELGGNFIDTAWIYGWDDKWPDRHPSEELIGKFLRESGKRDELVIATKIAPKDMNWPARKGAQIDNVFPNDWIEKCVDDSLSSLGVETIDLVQFHTWQDYFVEEDGWKETVKMITQKGKVKYWGISANDYQPSNCLQTLGTGLISSVQFIFNIFHQKPTERLLPYANKHNIGLIARVPLDEGGLGGGIAQKTEFQKGDLRNEYFKGERKVQLITRTDKLNKLMGSGGDSLSELALRFVLSHKEISTVIPGMRKVEYVERNTKVSDGRLLSSELLNKLKKHSWERNFYYPGLFYDPALKESEYIEK